MSGFNSFVSATRLFRDVLTDIACAPVQRGSRRNAAASMHEMQARSHSPLSEDSVEHARRIVGMLP